MKEALRYSAALLGELRTSLLGPQKYYELYMQVPVLLLLFVAWRSGGRMAARLAAPSCS